MTDKSTVLSEEMLQTAKEIDLLAAKEIGQSAKEDKSSWRIFGGVSAAGFAGMAAGLAAGLPFFPVMTFLGVPAIVFGMIAASHSIQAYALDRIKKSLLNGSSNRAGFETINECSRKNKSRSDMTFRLMAGAGAGVLVGNFGILSGIAPAAAVVLMSVSISAYVAVSLVDLAFGKEKSAIRKADDLWRKTFFETFFDQRKKSPQESHHALVALRDAYISIKFNQSAQRSAPDVKPAEAALKADVVNKP